jgi:hypothetical protein
MSTTIMQPTHNSMQPTHTNMQPTHNSMQPTHTNMQPRIHHATSSSLTREVWYPYTFDFEDFSLAVTDKHTIPRISHIDVWSVTDPYIINLWQAIQQERKRIFQIIVDGLLQHPSRLQRSLYLSKIDCHYIADMMNLMSCEQRAECFAGLRDYAPEKYTKYREFYARYHTMYRPDMKL